MSKKVLIVITSHDKMGDTDNKTGYWAEEFAAPFYVFQDAKHSITLASPAGGEPPVDPTSKTKDFETEATKRLDADKLAQEMLKRTVKLSEVNPEEFDAVFYPGGHGPVFDLHNDAKSIAIIESLAKAGKPVGAVCHGPAVLLKAKNAAGEPLVSGKAVTGFSNTEEDAVGLSKAVPYSLEDELKKNGGKYEKAADWNVHVVADGVLVTGQNPASSEGTAKKVLELL